MLMVIFGAGASYDSAQAYRPVYAGGSANQNFGPQTPQQDDGGPWRPPLAKDLFLDRRHVLGDIVARYPKLSHILPYLRESSNGKSVEEILESLQEEGRDNAESQREFASVRFYLCELLHKVTQEWSSQTNGITNYAPLIREILRLNRIGEQVCLVSFNYDLLLERALYSFNFDHKGPQEFLDCHPILKLFKLHGSVEWSRLVDVPEGTRVHPQGLIDQADTVRLSNTFVLANATDPRQMFTFEKPIFPAIAIPVQTKTEKNFECPSAHLTYLEGMLKNVTKVLIVGWQAREAHFLEMLRSNTPMLRYVMVVGQNAPDAEKILRHFVGQIGASISTSTAFLGQGGFTDFIVNREWLSFFNA
jgi:hypothetical protein